MARRPVQARSQEKYDAILAAAAELFAEHGFANTRVEDILDLAGTKLGSGSLTRGALYQFFDDKEEVASTVVTESLIFDTIQPLTPRLQSIVDASILLAVLTPHVTVIRAANRLATEQGKPFFGHLWRAYIPLITELVAQARDLGELKPGIDPQGAAELWVDGWVGLDLRFRENYGELATAVDLLNKHMATAVATPETLAQLTVTVQRGHDLVPYSQYEAEYRASVRKAKRRKPLRKVAETG